MFYFLIFLFSYFYFLLFHVLFFGVPSAGLFTILDLKGRKTLVASLGYLQLVVT